MNSEGKVTLPAARETVTFPSSSGWRITSSADLLNSGSSSRKRTPLWARLTSPGFGNALGQHRFSRSRRPDHQDVVTSGHRDFNGPFDVSLTLYVSEIDVIALVCGKKSGQIGACRKKGSFAAQERECLPQILDAVDIDLIDHRGFQRICFWNKQRVFATASRLERDWQDAFNCANSTVQGELTDEAEVFKGRAVQSLRYRDHPKGDRQVETGSFFFDIGRGKIDRRATAGPVIAAIGYRRGNPVAAFPHSGVWEPNDNDIRITAGAVDLDFNLVCVHAINSRGVNFCQHRRCSVTENPRLEKRQISL